MPWLNVFLSGTLCRNISLNVQGSVGATFMHCAVLCCIWFCYQGITWCKYYNRICSLYTAKCEWYCDGNTFSWPVSNTNSIPITSPVCVDAISKYGHKSTWHQSGNTVIWTPHFCASFRCYENVNCIFGTLNGSIIGLDIHFAPDTRMLVHMKMMG